MRDNLSAIQSSFRSIFKERDDEIRGAFPGILSGELLNLLQDARRSNGNPLLLLKVPLFTGWDYDLGFKAMLSAESPEIRDCLQNLYYSAHRR